MSTTGKQERRRREVREAILDAARAIAREEGWGAVTIRKVAERIDYRSPILYQHFASKEDLQVELLRAGFRDLRGRMEAAAATTDDPALALRRIARAYWGFAEDAPDLYQVMYGLGGVRFGVADTSEEGASIGAAVYPTAARLTPASAPADVEARVYLLWGTIHGLIALTLAGRLTGTIGGRATSGLADTYWLMERAIDDALAAWGKEKND